MKFGCCVSIDDFNKLKDDKSGISLFKKLGYDYLEFALSQVADLPETDFAKLRESVKAGEIPVECCNVFFPGTIKLTGEDFDQDTVLEYVKKACGRAAELGVKIIVLGSSRSKNIPDGFPREKAKEQFLGLLGKINDIVKPLGIIVAIEPLNSKESNFVVTGAEGLEIVRELNLSNIKLLIDYYHMRMEDENPQIIVKAGDDLCHMHIAAKEGRAFPASDDGEDYKALFDVIAVAGYKGRMSIEAGSTDIAADAAAAIKLIGPYLQ